MVFQEHLPVREKYRLPVPPRLLSISGRMQHLYPYVHRQLRVYEILGRGWRGCVLYRMLHYALHLHDRQCHFTVRPADYQLQPRRRQKGQGSGSPQSGIDHSNRRRNPPLVRTRLRRKIRCSAVSQHRRERLPHRLRRNAANGDGIRFLHCQCYRNRLLSEH